MKDALVRHFLPNLRVKPMRHHMHYRQDCKVKNDARFFSRPGSARIHSVE